jgi:hypothetical protein
MAYAIRTLTGFRWRDCHSIDTPKADYSPDGSRRRREAANMYVALYFGAGPRFNSACPPSPAVSAGIIQPAPRRIVGPAGNREAGPRGDGHTLAGANDDMSRFGVMHRRGVGRSIQGDQQAQGQKGTHRIAPVGNRARTIS